MPRDDELYALAREDQRIFFPGGHAGKARAIQALLNTDYHAKWHDRGDGKRFCGFVTVHRTAEDWWHLDRVPAEAWRVSKGTAAWAALVRDVAPEILGDVDARLAERPASLEDAISLASAPDTMMQAESLVREAFNHFNNCQPFGGVACPPILWRAMRLEACARSWPDRSAFAGLEAIYREALGGNWMDFKQRGRAAFEFSRYEGPPPLLKFAAEDFGEALTFDELRTRGFVSSEGVAFAGLENPFEPLLRAGRIGIVVQEVSARRVVLGASD